MITALLPKYDPTQHAASVNACPVVAPSDIVTLPTVIVSPPRLPSSDEILSQKGRAEALMDKYLGARDGLDRGILNRITLAELWGKIPILRLINFIGPPGSMSNEERAAALQPRQLDLPR